MLSYDTPVSVNGTTPDSSAVVTNNVPTTPPEPTQTMVSPPAPTSDTVANNGAATEGPQHIWLVTGPAGCGKSTVAAYLSKALNIPYIEGDEFHPVSNIEKMSNGIPLTDADRWDWLTALREESVRQLQGAPRGVVLTCSALKRKYRDVIRVAGYFDRALHIHFIYLSASESVLLSRVLARQNHYMGANMVHSQFQALEPPAASEEDVMSVDVSRPIEEVLPDVLARVLQTMRDESISAAEGL